MKNVAGTTIDRFEIASEIIFLKKEINFLLKLLKNAYSVSVNMEKIKLLDGFWKGFEENIARLDVLLARIQLEETVLHDLYIHKLIEEKKSVFNKEKLMEEYASIDKAVKALKENYYEYMAGCCACSYKNN